MSRSEFIFDDDELSRALVAACSGPLRLVANEIGAKIQKEIGGEYSVKIDKNRRARPVAMLLIKHPSALPKQAKRGTITRAVAEMGIAVTRARPPK